MSIGDNIKKLRTDKEYTQKSLAKALNVTQGAVSQWEQGLTSPDIDQLVTISRLFDVSVDFLLFGTHPDTDISKRNVASRLRLLMSMNKMDFNVLSERTGISADNIQHYYSGSYTPNWPDALKLAKALDVPVDYLLGRIDDSKRSPNIAAAEEAAADCLFPFPEQELKFALFGGDSEITDEQFEEVKQFAKAVLTRDRYKKS